MWMLMVVLLVIMGLLYNHLVQARNGVRNAFAQIDVQLQRRYELIPNLVASCKAYMSHEKETLVQLAQARQQGIDATASLRASPEDTQARTQLLQSERHLQTALGRMAMVVENYPELKADASIASLLEELTSTENRVSFARQAFNDAIMDYNNKRETLPAALVASALGFAPIEPLPAPEAEVRQPVRVDFS